jgi:hypothetical protein
MVSHPLVTLNKKTWKFELISKKQPSADAATPINPILPPPPPRQTHIPERKHQNTPPPQPMYKIYMSS